MGGTMRSIVLAVWLRFSARSNPIDESRAAWVIGVTYVQCLPNDSNV
jgi:hypothetical protein